jgi:hypothetical protein
MMKLTNSINEIKSSTMSSSTAITRSLNTCFYFA